jgi:hypothetical protein
MSDPIHKKKKRGTDMLMEKRAIHDMETHLQLIVDSDTRCNDIAKALVENRITDLGKCRREVEWMFLILFLQRN